MSSTANFKVDPRLASILGDSYASSEQALKELIDNSWDAEATEVRVTLPAILSDDPIIVEDNGSGMKSAEVRDEYLNIANPRWTRKGWHSCPVAEVFRDWIRWCRSFLA